MRSSVRAGNKACGLACALGGACELVLVLCMCESACECACGKVCGKVCRLAHARRATTGPDPTWCHARGALLGSEVWAGGLCGAWLCGRAEEGELAGPQKYAHVRPTGLLCTYSTSSRRRRHAQYAPSADRRNDIRVPLALVPRQQLNG